MFKNKLVFIAVMMSIVIFLISCSDQASKQYDSERLKQEFESTSIDTAGVLSSLEKLFALPEDSVTYSPLEEIKGVKQSLIFKGILDSDSEKDMSTLVFTSNQKDFYIIAFNNGGHSFDFEGKKVNIEKINKSTNKITVTVEDVEETSKNN